MGAKSAGMIEIFSNRPLWRLELEIPDRGVIEQAVSDDVMQGCRLWNITAAKADHGHELAFEIQLFENARPDDGGAVTDKAG